MSNTIKNLVIGISTIALIGLVGYFTYSYFNKLATESTTDQAVQDGKIDNVNKQLSRIEIPEWSLVGSYDSATLGELSYATKDFVVTFSSSKVNQLLPCAGIDKDSWGFEINPAETETKTQTIPGVELRRIYPSAGCESKSAEMSAIDKAYIELFDSLKKTD